MVNSITFQNRMGVQCLNKGSVESLGMTLCMVVYLLSIVTVTAKANKYLLHVICYSTCVHWASFQSARECSQLGEG